MFIKLFFLLWPNIQIGSRPPHCRCFQVTHNQTRTHTHTRQDSSERVIIPSHRPLPTQQTNIHALSGILTRDPSNQAAAKLRLIPHGQRIRSQNQLGVLNFEHREIRELLSPPIPGLQACYSGGSFKFLMFMYYDAGILLNCKHFFHLRS